MPKIKICGLSKPDDIGFANEAAPDYIGFVFAESRRRVTPEQAFSIKSRLAESIKAVGVFVNAEFSFILSLCCEGVIDIIQLHGDESPDYIRSLKSVTDRPVIKAFRVKSPREAAEAEISPADMILFDAYSPKAIGGTGNAFDWNLIKSVRRPFFIAGGLTEENIPDAFRELSPYGFDVSGGAEKGGVKDREKMINIVKLVRSIK